MRVLNTEFAKTWPNITVKCFPAEDAKEWDGKPDMEKLFSSMPGQGD
jgi:ferredoxin